MAKARRVFVCTSCGAQAPSWTGRCTSCDGWATIEEQAVERVAVSQGPLPELVPLDTYDRGGSIPLPTGLPEVDRVLGGGLVAGSVSLLSGEPGIGKSTLTLQLAMAVAATGSAVVLVTGEEAPVQVSARAARLGEVAPTLQVLDNTDVATICRIIEESRPQLVVVDSIQTLRVDDLDGAPGSVAQIREAAARIVHVAKRTGVSVLLVGHVTKDGGLAGPRLLEHIVDTVLSFTGERSSGLRYLRSVKHRFGPTTEVGLFEMSGEGLSEVEDPSGRFLADRANGCSGSIVVPVLDGHRPVLVEVQALVTPSVDPSAHLSAQGIAVTRLKLVLAVIERRLGHRLADFDVFASLAGGVRSDDPGIDLGLTLALWSAWADIDLGPDVVACGEVGLAGEVRGADQARDRLQEAYRMGFRRAIVPHSTSEGPTGLDLHRCQTIDHAVHAVAPVDVTR